MLLNGRVSYAPSIIARVCRYQLYTYIILNLMKKQFHTLPDFYWMPKLHKNPYGHCFIAASASCTTKSLSKLLTHCLQLILKQCKEYCKGIERRTGVNCFLVISNSTEVTNTVDKLRHARALDSFDFSTLYTNTPP